MSARFTPSQKIVHDIIKGILDAVVLDDMNERTMEEDVILLDGDEPEKKKTRKSWSFKEKAEIISKYYEIKEEEGDVSYRVLSEQLGVTKSILNDWVLHREKIYAKAADEKISLLKKGRPAKKHHGVYPLLYKKFKDARSVGKKVNFKWIWFQGMKIAREKNLPTFTHGATQDFNDKYGIRLRKVQRKKQYDKESYEPKLIANQDEQFQCGGF